MRQKNGWIINPYTQFCRIANPSEHTIVLRRASTLHSTPTCHNYLILKESQGVEALHHSTPTLHPRIRLYIIILSGAGVECRVF